MITLRFLAYSAVFALVTASAAFADLDPREGYWGDDKTWADHSKLVGKPMPALNLSHWVNSKPLTPAELKGKIVVFDFWATWCGPCLRALPHNNEVWDKYKAKGVVVLAVCGSRGQEKMEAIVKDKALRFPIARDADLKTAPAWGVKWWPTYAVVDRKGIVRALGIKPDAVEPALEALLKEQPYLPAKVAAGTVNPDWLEGSPEKRQAFADLEKYADNPPPLELTAWQNTEPIGLDKLKGKVVLLDFWATWCGPCLQSIPHTNEFYEQHRDQGLVVLGVCHTRGAEKMAETAEKHGIKYPIAADVDGKTVDAYRVNSFPDYYFIDRSGRLRIVDCKNGSIEEAAKQLLAEPAG